MSAPYWNLRAKVQDAVAAYLLTDAERFCTPEQWPDNPTLVPVRKGFSSDMIEAYPMVCVIADKSSRYLPEVVSQNDNTRLVNVKVSIRTAADEVIDSTAEAFHADLVARVYDLLNATDLVTQLNAAGVADLTVQQVDLGDESQATFDSNMDSTQELAVVAMPQ